MGQFCQEIHGIFVVVFPEFSFVDTFVVSCEKFTVGLLIEQGHGEHGHGVEMLREVCDEWGFTLAEATSLFPFVWEIIKFGLVGVATCCEQEEHAFGEGLDSSWYFLGVFAELGDGMSSEGDTWDGVEAGTVVKHNGKSSHAKDGIIDLDLSDNIVAMLFSEFDEL